MNIAAEIRREAGAQDRAAGAIDDVCRAVLHGVRAGLYAPGQHLPEADLVRRLGTSRSSLREAMRRLSVEGVVTLSRYKGASIAALDDNAAADLLVVLEPIACLAARLAARPGTAGERRRIVDAASVIERAARRRDREGCIESRRDFYGLMIGMSGNIELARYGSLSRVDLLRVQSEMLLDDDRRLRHADDLARVARAISEGDDIGAEAMMKAHFRHVRQHIRVM